MVTFNVCSSSSQVSKCLFQKGSNRKHTTVRNTAKYRAIVFQTTRVAAQALNNECPPVLNVVLNRKKRCPLKATVRAVEVQISPA